MKKKPARKPIRKSIRKDASAPAKPKKPKKSTEPKGRDPRLYLSGAAPGLWATNHLEEAQQVKLWQFVAIRTLARMCSQATLEIHNLADSAVATIQKRVRVLEKSLKRAQQIENGTARTVRTEYLEFKIDSARKLLKASAEDSAKNERSPVTASHPLKRLLERPNPEWSGNTFIYAIVQQLAATGVAMIWTVTNGMGVPVEMYVCPTGLMIPRMPTPEFPMGSYYLTPISVWGLQPGEFWQYGAIGQAMLTGTELDARDIKKICWPHPVYLTDGMSPLAACNLWVDLAAEMDRASWYSFENSERPGLVFKRSELIDPSPDDVAQFREDLRGDSAGTNNTGKHLLLPKGVQAENWALANKEMEFVGSRPQIQQMNLAIHGVSPGSCGISEPSSYAQFWAELKQTEVIAVQPTLDMIGGELSELLGDRFPGGRNEVTYKSHAVDDPQLKIDEWDLHIKAGNAVTVDEYRKAWNLPLFGDERGEEFVGVKTSVRVAAADEEADTPGVQVGPDTGGSGASSSPAKTPMSKRSVGLNGVHKK